MPPEKFRAVAGGPFEDIARQLNELRRFAISIKPVSGRNIQCDDSGSYGVTVNQAKVKGGGEAVEGVLKQYLVDATEPDYLECRLYSNGSASGNTVYIAKPHELRRTPWHGVTITFVHEFNGATFTITYTHAGDNARTGVLRTSQGVIVATEKYAIIPRYLPGVTVINAMEVEQEMGVTAPGEVTKVDVSNRAWVRILS